jgi:hypothetical protein
MTHLLLGAQEVGTPRRLPRPLALEIATANFAEFHFRDCMKKVGRVVVRYSSMHETYEKALPNRPF